MFFDKFIITNNITQNIFINKCIKKNISIEKAIIYSKYYINYKTYNCSYSDEIMKIILNI
jgi:hypothetical protein